MVTDASLIRDRLSGAGRAQMILIGAIALAVVIVGLTVVMNSLLVTESTAPGETTTQLDEAQAFDYESRKGVRSIALRLNHWERNWSSTALNEAVQGNVTNFSRLMAESFATSKAGYVNVSYDPANSSHGARIVQADDGAFENAGGAADWQPVDAGQRREVGWFTMNLNVSRTDEAGFAANVTNETGHWVNVTVNKTGTGPAETVVVSTNVSHAGNATARCDPSRGRVLLDLVEGESFDGDCEFNGTRELGSPYDIELVNGQNANGKYEIALNESVSSGGFVSCHGTGTPPDVPCQAPIVWTANVTTRFQGSDVGYVDTYNVTVYEEGR